MAVRRDLQEERVRDRQRHPGRAVRAARIPLNKTLKIGRVDFRSSASWRSRAAASWAARTSTARSSSRSPRTCARSAGGAGSVDMNIAIKAPSQEAMADLEYDGDRRDAQAPPAAARRARRLLDQQARHAGRARSTTSWASCCWWGCWSPASRCSSGAVGRHEHHVRLRHRADARDRHPQGRSARRGAASCCSSCSSRPRSACSAALIGIVLAAVVTAVINATRDAGEPVAARSWPSPSLVSIAVGVAAGVAPALPRRPARPDRGAAL